MPHFLPLAAHSFAHGLRDALAPARCIGCLAEDTWHCADCKLQFRPHRQSCIVCNDKDSRAATCFDCRSETALHGVLNAGPYQDPSLRRGIGWLKFKGVRALAGPLARLLAPHLNVIAPPGQLRETAALVPIPLHPRRTRRRGFNQSALIASAISGQTGIPVAPLLIRSRATFAQSKLPRELRKQNTANAFTVNSLPLASSLRHLILIDDVTTSGSTLSAAATALKNNPPNKGDAGGLQIWAATIARGYPRK